MTRWRRHFIKLSVLTCISLVLFSCTKPTLLSHSNTTTLSSSNYYFSNNAVARIYYVTNDLNPGLFITELDTSGATLTVPRPVLDSLEYGSRKNLAQPQYMDLILRVTQDPLTNGDFYFETPILSGDVKVSNTTTAVSWLLRWSFNGVPIQISQNLFDEIVNSIELICTDCRSKTTSNVLELILNSPDIKGKILSRVSLENPSLILSPINFNPPELIYGWSRPNLIENGKTLADSNEGDQVHLELKMVRPMNSSRMVGPEFWDHTFQRNLENLTDSPLLYNFDFSQMGIHQFSPRFIGKAVDGQFEIKYDVSDTNRNPFCDMTAAINMRANRVGRFELSTVCSDLDVDEAGLVYVFNEGPKGMTISTTGVIEYTPPLLPDKNDYDVPFSFVLIDSKQARILINGTIHVAKDALPTFENLPTTMNFTEGLPEGVNFDLKDFDGDPLKLRVTPIDPISTGLPTGSGNLAVWDCQQVGQLFHCQWFFQPSWMQVIGQNGSARVKFSLIYDAAKDPTLNGTIELTSQEVVLNFINTDDPPQFVTPPIDLYVKEGLYYGGVNKIVVTNVIDSPTNPTTVDFGVLSAGTSCEWLGTIQEFKIERPSNEIVTDGSIDYGSAAVCTVSFVATDQNGLSTESSEFQVIVEDTNQPVSLNLQVPRSTVLAKEGEVMREDLSAYFYDQDVVDKDPREIWTFLCRWDSDGDGSYDQECSNQAIPPATGELRIGFDGIGGMGMSWLPKPGSGNRTYSMQLTVTDKGGTQATHLFDIQVEEAPSPMQLMISEDLVNSSTVIKTTENATQLFYVSALAPSDRPIDQYDFKISPPTCFKVGGGTCRAGIIKSPTDLVGNGSKDFVFQIETTADYNSGDAVLPSDSSDYLILFHLEDLGGLNLTADAQVKVTVKNTNRNPTALSVLAKNESCVGTAVPDAGSGDFTICVDASKDIKSGSLWSKTYYLDFGATDPDTTNDTFTYFFNATNAPGAITGNRWSFKLGSCVSNGLNTITRTYPLNLSDGRGGTLSRNIILRIIKAQASSLCM